MGIVLQCLEHSSFVMIIPKVNFLCWNVRGLNDPDRRATVHETIASTSCHIVCLQETKMENIDQYIASYLGGNRLRSFAQRPATGSRGGLLMLWDDSVVRISDVHITEFCLSAMVNVIHSDTPFKITSVYGPTASNRKDDFFSELIAQKPINGTKWIVMGDFNQIYRARDKNNRNINRSRLNRFRATLDTCELKEIHLQNRRFTWSNERQNPTLCKLDSVFCNADWDMHFDSHVLHAISSLLSDHCPLLLADDRGPKRPRCFRFENFWSCIPGFFDTVSKAWEEPCAHTEPYQRLFHKLKQTGRHLSKWSNRLFSKAKLHLHAALLVILRLDVAQETRVLSGGERELRARLKRRVVSLAAVERARKKQCARIVNIKEGDVNTKFFHLRVNSRRRKNHIHRLKKNSGWITDHEEKEEIIHDHFASSLGGGQPRPMDLNWENLNLRVVDLTGIDDNITEDEVKAAIDLMPGDKAPGPDGFTGSFFKKCWQIIKVGVMRVIHQYSSLQTTNLHWLNSANIVLIPKKDGAEEIGDFRPISLTHSAAKLFAKMLALRARKRMKEVVAANQSAFIQGRNLHDNFLLVRQVARNIQERKEPGVFLKLDISRAFDSLSWPFLFEVLRQKGFGAKWIGWISILLRTASTKVGVIGVPGKSVIHACGLRQGDPVSPLLFVIAMDVLTHIFRKGAEEGVLSSFRGITPMQRVSIYADDVALFIRPIEGDLNFVRSALQAFGRASGLSVNYSKSSAILIRGSEQDQSRVEALLQCNIAEFPCKYLGLQLAIRQLTRGEWQPILDKAKKLVPAWQRGLIQRPGRLVLVKSVMAARPVHHLMVMDAPKWVFEELDKWMRAFFWTAEEKVNGGNCLVAWDTICTPVCFGGLGVKNLELQALALRVRWEWLRRTDPDRPWQKLHMVVDREARQVFDSLVSITVGNGAKTLFWRDRWLHGLAIVDIAPQIHDMVDTRTRNRRTVQQALEDNSWVQDVAGELSFTGHIQFLNLCQAIATTHRDDSSLDTFAWPADASGQYSARSVYNMLCQGRERVPYASCIWRSWAPLKCKIHVWLTIQHRIWTSDRRARHGLQDHPSACFTCLQEEDNAEHIHLQCSYASQGGHQ